MIILVVEDNEAINNLLVKSLLREGYKPIPVFDGKEAADYVERYDVDLILLDIMLPNISGEELVYYFVEYNIPIILLTAKNGISDKVRGLRLGADDYITKPFELEELFARIESVLRRNKRNSESIIIWQNIRLEIQTKSVYLNNDMVYLTPKEYQLFLFLIQNRGIILEREVIYQRIWEAVCESDSRTLDLHIQRLKKKLNLGAKLRAIYGVGYLMED